MNLHANATVVGACASTVVVWVASLFGVDVPGEVGAAFATMVGIGCGAVYGNGEPKT